MKTCTLFNSQSGGAETCRDQIHDLAERHRSKLIYLDQLESSQSVADVVLAEKPDRVLVVGGDGTISRTLADADWARDIPIGLIPTGTGNDFARSLGIPLGDVSAAWQIATEGSAIFIDTMKTSFDQPGRLVNAITAGIGGQVAKELESETKENFGALAYWLAALQVLTDPPVFHLQLELDGKRLEMADAYAICLANGRYAGGGFAIAPSALLNDGLIQVTVLPVMSSVELIDEGIYFLLTHEHASDRIQNHAAKKVELIADAEIPCSLDGERESCQRISLEIEPASRQVIATDEAAITLTQN